MITCLCLSCSIIHLVCKSVTLIMNNLHYTALGMRYGFMPFQPGEINLQKHISFSISVSLLQKVFKNPFFRSDNMCL